MGRQYNFRLWILVSCAIPALSCFGCTTYSSESSISITKTIKNNSGKDKMNEIVNELVELNDYEIRTIFTGVLIIPDSNSEMRTVDFAERFQRDGTWTSWRQQRTQQIISGK